MRSHLVIPLSGLLVAVLLEMAFTSSGTLAQQAPPTGQSTIPSEKLLVLQQDAAHLAAARARPQPPKGVSTSPRVSLEPGKPAFPRTTAGQGTIVETGLSRFGPDFVVENHWYEKLGAEELGVYAGAMAQDSAQGILAVLRTDTYGTPMEQTWYPTPARAGSVRVVAAAGQRLTVQPQRGATFVFDVPTRQFVAP